MKNWILILFLLVGGMSSCQRSNSYTQSENDKEKCADNTLKKVALKLKREKGLSPVGTMGQMLNEIQKLGLSFYYYKPVDIVEGRRLLVDSVNAMLDEINQDTRIHPFLIRNPFLPRNIEIRIILCDQSGRSVKAGSLWGMHISDGNLYYKIEHPETGRPLTVYKETYEEALERIADPTLLLVPFQPDPEISQEELARLRKGISFVTDDGSIWQLGDDGCWIKPKLKENSESKSSAFWYAPELGLADEHTPFVFEESPGIAAGTRLYAEIEKRVLQSEKIEGIALRCGCGYGPGTWFHPGLLYCKITRSI